MAEAKAKLSEVVDQAASDGPQIITRSGRDVAVLVSVEEWKKAKEAVKPKQPFGDFLMNSPPRGSGLKIERLKGKTRPVEF